MIDALDTGLDIDRQFDGLTDWNPRDLCYTSGLQKNGIVTIAMSEPVDHDDFLYTVSEFNNHLPVRVPHSIQLPSRNL